MDSNKTDAGQVGTRIEKASTNTPAEAAPVNSEQSGAVVADPGQGNERPSTPAADEPAPPSGQAADQLPEAIDGAGAEASATDQADQTQGGPSTTAGVAVVAEAPASYDATDTRQSHLAEGDGSIDRPAFLVDLADLPDTALRLVEMLAQKVDIYTRGGAAVILRRDKATDRLRSDELTTDAVVMLAHRLCRPYVEKIRSGGVERLPVTLADRAACYCLTSAATAGLPVLAGITRSPLVSMSGEFFCRQGYDPASRMFCDAVPAVAVLERPTREQAEAALARLRIRLRTFPFADSRRVRVAGCEEPVVDVSQPPSSDESALLVAVAAATAICRQSLPLAPGVVIGAPYISGAGSGKGLLARYLGEIAYGMPLRALTPGHSAEEMDKRIASELMTTNPVVFLDNVNDTDLRSN